MESQKQPVRGGQERLLVVDDEPAIRNLLGIIMRRFGYEVIVACDGEEALDIFSQKQKEIDLILLDLTMPKLSGRDTLKKIREISADVPVIISSGYPIDRSEFEADTGLAVTGFIQKPYEAMSIAKSVREILDARNSSGASK